MKVTDKVIIIDEPGRIIYRISPGIRSFPCNQAGLEAFFSQAVREKEKIGTSGFEPLTPCTPSMCATRLRHVPIGEKG